MVAYARRCQRAFQVTAEELQFELIRQVGITGSFLETGHTLAHCREAFYQPEILNRVGRELCPGPLPEVARRRTEEIIARDQEEKITPDALKELKRIEDKFRLT